MASKENTVKISEMRDYMITIDNWTLELAQVQDDESFTSYLGLEMRLIIHKFSQYSKEKVDLPNRYPSNLYRDEFACACIQSFLLSQQLPQAEKSIQEELGKKDMSAKCLDKLMQPDSAVIKVKSAPDGKPKEFSSTLKLQKDGKEGEIFTGYSFLKELKTEVLTMNEVIQTEHISNPKEVMKKLAQQAKQRRKDMDKEIDSAKPAKT